MDSVEAEGNSIDEAIESALKMLDAPRERVAIEILTNAARGLFGIGGRKARVRATVRVPIDTADDNLGPVETVEASPQPKAASAGTTREAPSAGEGVQRAREVLEAIIRHLKVDATVTDKRENGDFVFELGGDASGVLIGRRGQMLDALEYLMNRIATRDEVRAARIIVDSENYRARRRAALEGLAHRMADQAKKKRRAVTLSPMSPRDRRVIHMILHDIQGLTTRSSGKGYLRKVVIIPAGAARPAEDADEDT